jgi:long-chain acyl-CoA synthetase
VNLAALVAEHPASAPALYHGGEWIDWGTVRRRAAAGAVALQARGVGAGHRVALVLPTSPDFVVGYLAVLATGAVAVPLNPGSPPTELEGELRAVGAGTVIAAAGLSVPDVGEPGGAGAGVVTVDGPAGWSSWSADTGNGAPAYAPLQRDDGDVAVLLFTSGTAGRPRAAMLTHGNLVANLHQMLAVPGEMVRPDDVVSGAVPLFHVFGLNVVLGLTLVTGAALVLEERFDATASLRRIEELGVTLVFGVPAMFVAWAEAAAASPPSARGGGWGRVRRAVSGASALAPAVAVAFERALGVAVWQGYGLTEAGPAVATSVGAASDAPGSVGRPLPGVSVRLVDDDGDDVLDGDPGEIWVRGANVFAGYWADREATDGALTPDGWLRTGDVGVLGPGGDLSVVDRAKDLVIVSGFNVFPAEVEQCIAGLPGVAEVVVVGRPDDRSGEAVEAVVVAPGADLSAEQVAAWCRSRMAGYKCPTSVRFVDELPHGLSGKALRRAVRQGG